MTATATAKTTRAVAATPAIIGRLATFAAELRGQTERMDQLKAIAATIRAERDRQFDEARLCSADGDHVAASAARNEGQRLMRQVQLLASMQEHLAKLSESAGGLCLSARHFERGD